MSKLLIYFVHHNKNFNIFITNEDNTPCKGICHDTKLTMGDYTFSKSMHLTHTQSWPLLLEPTRLNIWVIFVIITLIMQMNYYGLYQDIWKYVKRDIILVL